MSLVGKLSRVAALSSTGYDTPIALSKNDIKSLVEKFGLAAKEDVAGFEALDVRHMVT